MDYRFLIQSIVMQLVVFCIVPFLYWLIRRRKQASFFRYVGLTLPRKAGKTAEIAVFALGYIVVYGIVHFVPAIAALTQPSASAYAGLGAAALVPAVFVCFVQQGLAEEILFRGFIGKRFDAKFGFAAGNVAQATVFGLVHVLLSVSNERDFLAYAIIFVSTAAGGWLLGFLTEKLCGGSIFPGILLHGLGNYIMILTAAF